MTDNEQTLYEEDAFCIERPETWAEHPVLPLIRYRAGTKPEYGALIDPLQVYAVPFSPVHPFTVYGFNFFADGIPFECPETKVYQTVKEMMADGWVVD